MGPAKLGSSKVIANKATRPDHQRWDAVTIETVPRWKESELSGDEYRILAEGKLFYKGHTVKKFEFSNVDNGIRYLDGAIIYGHEEWDFIDDSFLCDQESCTSVADVKYKRLHGYTSRGDPETIYDWNLYRVFCNQHKTRGDCADDSDQNYEQVEFLPEEVAALERLRQGGEL